jgi:LmbE family N-acetylglucosaminyl deacetylase
VDAPSPKIEDDVQADVGLVQKKGVKEDSKAIIDLSVPSLNSSSAAVNGLDNNPDEATTNCEINGYSNHSHHVNGVVEDEEEVDSKAQALEMDKGQYVGDGSWEEKTWKELVRLREDMFWARLGRFRG